ncbi:hypothetical protein [Polaromonas sp.]|uniref:hypothetical protein n=1 Tax=Polaromonas sp. TaxID=1869339 RepID=UPI00286D69CE|nr:hypothetical protein [Polaromonas sp.]
MILSMILIYLHLIATCAAIGTIVITDLRLLAKVLGYRVVIPAPQRFETITIGVALLGLYVTGGALIMLGLADRPDYLANGKLQGKLVLVGLLTANAFVLHHRVFPILQRSRPVSAWTRGHWLTVALAVSLSNSAWFFTAFLGIARPWNHAVTPGFVLLLALLAWGALFVLVNAVLMLASRDAPKADPDWIDAVKSSWSELSALNELTPAKKR